MRFAALFSIIVGLAMIGQWSVSFVTRKIPELLTEPIRIWFHIAAEMVTALGLVISGVGILFSQEWARNLFLVSSGMLIYTSIVSPGYFAQKGQWPWLVVFLVVIVLALVSIFLVL